MGGVGHLNLFSIAWVNRIMMVIMHIDIIKLHVTVNSATFIFQKSIVVRNKRFQSETCEKKKKERKLTTEEMFLSFASC